jgi:hypothetical protein
VTKPEALLIGFSLVPFGYAVQWVLGGLVDWWTAPRTLDRTPVENPDDDSAA